MDTKDRDLLVEISVMYYLEGKTQTEISKEMFMSRPKVSRLLKKARDLNIVDIKINYDSDDINRVAKQIQHRFGVSNVIVVKTLSSEEETIRQIGKAAANELKYYIKDGVKIGMSWGRTVKAMVDAFKPKNMKDIKIVELFGAVEYGDESQEYLSIGYEFSQKVNGTYYSLPSPLYINDVQTRKILMENPIIKNTITMIDDCDFIVTSIGVVNSSLPQRIWDAHVDPKSRKELLDLGAQGYLCAHFFDQNGQFINHPINDNIIGIKTDSIRNNQIMLIAGGPTKWAGIHAILKGGYVNTLVSDDETLKKVLAEDKKIRGEFL
ncbi:sugar-binding transcriptional regulator [Candidatus Xianfuyuplasma coldseepsis]|uniref:Sugar-binding transcriptional regulator n=1 Tax=Candidatus Xianfuyuplasma coldseepsis TaxID=2782163 RepID=A0A7L7KU45_9MOLU|nr:sugar-binding transcriptional regulator [Xianfuyuplasma coldseepsis]QMS85766.1 sugar-binding transcriptional regulator [Xianfuyuplasma coldseepsis]